MENKQIDYKQELAKLREENAKLKEQLNERAVFLCKNGNIACRVKGRSPINLYKDQWETILENAARIKEFLIAHKDTLQDAPEQTEEQQASDQDAEQYNVA